MPNQLKNQPQAAVGRARVETVPASIVITITDRAEIGFALGAMNAAGIAIVSASPGRVVVRGPRTRLRTIIEALEGVGFSVYVGAPATTEEA